MRIASVAQIKRSATRKFDPEPQPGTKLRELWDLLQANRGVPVPVIGDRDRTADMLRKLDITFGLDIVTVRPQSKHSGARQVMLVGEWFGRKYVDYRGARREINCNARQMC